MKKNKRTVIALGALICVAAVFVGAYFATRGATSEGSKTLTIEIVHGNGDSKEYTIHTDAEYLGQALMENEELGVIGEDGPYGLYIKAVNGIPLDYDKDGAYWGFYVDDAYATAGVDETTIVETSVYRLQAEKG